MSRSESSRARVEPGAQPRGLGIVALALLCVSTGAIFARLAHSPALVVSLWRCGLAALVLAALAGRRPLPRPPALSWRSAWGTPLLCGALLAAHFGLWIRSLELTSVGASVFLVATTPLWVALASPRVTGEPLGRPGWIGLGLGLTGSLLIALDEADPARPGWAGPALAVGGALSLAAYALITRRARAELPLRTYLVRVWGSASAILAALCLLSGATPLPSDGEAALWLAAGGLVPQLVGHSSINAALRLVPAALVTLALLGEPVLTTLWAWLLFAEVPRPALLTGGALVLAGIGVAGRRRAPR